MMKSRSDDSPEWMPVFVVHNAMRTVHASGPNQFPDSPDEPSREGAEVWQRVGTAFARADGAWEIVVSVVPLDGRFVMRPPASGEECHAAPIFWR
jgi:hypothetical protein